MPLPMTKRQFDRLGDRLIAHESPSDAGLTDLETALTAYQEVLELVKLHLRGLGFAATPRVKTTTTMTDKLRRTPGMDLSRMQDIAGARITVRNLAAQDEAKDKISGFYAAEGCRWREIDRRADPRFGYRAVHLVVHVDELPVEIQIRTELQNSWAQIVERLGDRWGRGIRYGQDPENPEGIVRSGETVSTRRGLLARLMTLSDTILSVEQSRRAVDTTRQALAATDSLWQEVQSEASPDLLATKLPPHIVPLHVAATAALTARSEELDPEARELLAIPAANLTQAQVRHLVEVNLGFVTRDHSVLVDRLAATE